MGKRTAWEEIDKKAPEVLEISDAIWSFAEMGYQENESMRLLCEMLQKEGVPGQRGPGGEFDALSGLSQEAGLLEESGRPGTVRYFGCPAEEGGSGKTFMTKAGVLIRLRR